MCGLAGMAGDFGKKHVDAFNHLLVLNQFRGNHSTGVASVGGTSAAPVMQMLKRVGCPNELFECKSYDSVVNMGRRVIIGHGRHATVGEKTRDNAHPFQFANVLGAHNGTIEWAARKHLIDGAKFGTDSEGLYNTINEVGVKDALAKVWGAWALTFYTPGNHRINLVRNKERPLTFCFTADRKVLFWASEASMLRFILDRFEIDREEREVKTDDGQTYKDRPIYNLPVDQLWSWEIPPFGQPFREVQVEADVIAGKEEPAASKQSLFPSSQTRGYGYTGHGLPWEDDDLYGYEDYGTRRNYTEYRKPTHEVVRLSDQRQSRHMGHHDQSSAAKSHAPVGPLSGYQRDHNNKLMTKAAFDEAIKTRPYCEWCGENELEYQKCRGVAKGVFVCNECCDSVGIVWDDPGDDDNDEQTPNLNAKEA